MEITEVRIKLIDDSTERLRAFCSITFDDCFVVRDLKIIDGANGPFVAMPSRKLTIHCPACRCKNHARASYCNQCGTKLRAPAPIYDDSGRAKLYADIAHPINAVCRDMIQRRVVEAFEEELILASQPGYVCRYDEIDDLSYEETRNSRKIHDTVRRLDEENLPLTPCQTDNQSPAPETVSDAHFGKGIF